MAQVQKPAPPHLALMAAGVVLGLGGCAQQAAPHVQGSPAAATESAPPAPPTQGDVSPPPAVTVEPDGTPEAHPHAPESLPNKPVTIPEEMPGVAPPR
ncbi:hypothetical protein LJR219_002521 [Phenylobacterium sp. LjRoot219]|uniref:hypothetical protein n=1 Tax=Phenylobacterium sp. LjRoot219 TaxID=3342283 RepID=UPI003ECC8E02